MPENNTQTVTETQIGNTAYSSDATETLYEKKAERVVEVQEKKVTTAKESLRVISKSDLSVNKLQEML